MKWFKYILLVSFLSLVAQGPAIARYIQADPIGLEGGWNRFLYVDGDPLLDIDPEGLQRRSSGAPVIPIFPRIGPTLPPPNPQVGTTRAPVEVRPGSNLPGEINGRSFSGHAFDRMQGRGLPPSAVIDTLLYGRQNPGSRPNTTQFHDPVNNITVVTNSTTGNVITVRNGPPSNSCATRGNGDE
ncbi:RHS repeat-associated core domain-containing protein [Acidovorax sp. SUPP2539]|uniref:RHS repeat-associated core domain-containing protein n=1 Tax=Acidovorax sp. SUPP2539 TaxID=2920878 RepID=UPI0024E12460|nr:RHS repeat-associated core domain-containing protein [Acidovorax sp. SUPP2539]